MRKQAPIIAAGLSALVAVLLSIVLNYLPDWPQAWEGYRAYVWLIVIGLSVLAVGLTMWQVALGQSDPGFTAAQERRYRQRMIKKVRFFWIKGVLEQSLYREARIELELKEKPDALRCHPWGAVIHLPSRESRQIPPNTPVSTVFDEMEERLLILGDPGAGKTTILLELASELLDRAEIDRDGIQPIPVVLNLSSWAGLREEFDKWLVDEMDKRYGLPGKIGKVWVESGHVIPLLDGLDEVAKEHRVACVEAINAFLQRHRLMPMAICCRSEDYDDLAVRLQMLGAIVVQPLTKEQVETFLEQAGDPLQGVRIALREDPVLWDLLDTPLMMSIVSIAYKELPASEVSMSGTLDQRRERLFAAYVETMFKRSGRSKPEQRQGKAPYSREQTSHWLSWLARAMLDNNLSVFYLDQIRHKWLPSGTFGKMSRRSADFRL